MTPELLAAALADRYRIERELGAGGMATVYLAHDLKHDRQVAIKVLRPELAAVIGAERFLSEIKTTANLQHPHILPLFDSGVTDRRTDGPTGRLVESFLYYVMPFIEGEALRDRINREKQLPVADAVRIATEVAGALDYAHRHNVIHRDIKPENILLHDGRALVADFGIALAASKAGGTRMTETGMSLGTPTYMSPEQAMGEREITARSDVYALGCVLYEMLVGEPPFTGPTAQAIVAKVMTAEPAMLTQQRRTIPPGIEAAVLTALEKLPADRFATAAEFAAALANPMTTTARAVGTVRTARTVGRTGITVVTVATVALIAGLMLGGRMGDPGSVGPGDVVRATLSLGDSVTVRAIGNLRLAMAPSGRRIAFIGPDGTDDALWVRDLDRPGGSRLADTKGAFAPFFSPDGQSLGFFTTASGKTVLKVIAVAGGVPRTVVGDSVASFGGGDWGDDGQIYFTHSTRGLARVAPTGGRVTVVSTPDSGGGVLEHDYPDVLPGSGGALVMLWKGSIGSNQVGLVDLKTGAVTELTPGSMARYMPPGFIAIGGADGRLMVARFDLDAGKLRGTPALIMQDVQEENSNGTVQFGVSETGTLVYQRKSTGAVGVVWVDRSGRKTPVDTALVGTFMQLALSPDGRQIALARSQGGETQIWVKQLPAGAFSRLSFDVQNADRPVWTPDGRRVAFLATRNNRRTAWMQRADGSDSVQPASPQAPPLDEIWFDPLGRYTVFRSQGGAAGTRRLSIMRTGVDTIARTLLQSRFDTFAMVVSPDGQWLAYVSNESGTPEVYVRPFPEVDAARFAISVGGGVEPLWKRDGTELFFRSPRGDMFAVPVTLGRRFSAGPPRLLFSVPGLPVQDYHRSYDVHPDGKRFLMLESGGSDASELNLILNWRAELGRLETTAP
ncbi:MAG: protein kinase [Gemmatimonadetes bacterium]|nr:protein kinase [Gemmatimonadota bacterium]